jgi:hypothetical protein
VERKAIEAKQLTRQSSLSALIAKEDVKERSANEETKKKAPLLPPKTNTLNPEASEKPIKVEEKAIEVEKLSIKKSPIVSEARETGRDGRFVAYDSGTVLDTKTNLMWAAKDNNSKINWYDAKSYCQNYQGGGYTDWRMPTLDELEGLYDPNNQNRYGYKMVTDLIEITHWWVWSSEVSDSKARAFRFRYILGIGKAGSKRLLPQRFGLYNRVLPVRSVE